MSDTMFNCKLCGQSLEAPADMAGELIDCPQCQKTIEIPFPRSVSDTPKYPPQKRPPLIFSVQQPSLAKKIRFPLKKILRCHEVAIGVAVALFIALVVFSVWHFNPRTEVTREVKQTSSQAKKELSARLIHEANYNEFKAKWDQINSLQQIGFGDNAELAKAADNLERAMVIEFQKAHPPDWITKQQSEGVFEKNGGWSQYTFATSNEDLAALMFKRVNETATEVAKKLNREFAE